jgi:nuclear transport factor 2 (NTF2) superfamily protein
MAEEAWNTRDPERAPLACMVDISSCELPG